MTEHWFWWLLTLSCVLWYTTITVYVAVKGFSDIKYMLRRLENEQRKSAPVD